MPCAFLLHRILLRICILLLFRSFSILRNLLHLIFIHLHLYTFFLGFFKFLSLSSYFAFFALFTMFSAFFFFTFFSHSSLIYSTHSSSKFVRFFYSSSTCMHSHSHSSSFSLHSLSVLFPIPFYCSCHSSFFIVLPILLPIIRPYKSLDPPAFVSRHSLVNRLGQ